MNLPRPNERYTLLEMRFNVAGHTIYTIIKCAGYVDGIIFHEYTEHIGPLSVVRPILDKLNEKGV